MRKVDAKEGRVVTFDEAADRSRYLDTYVRLLGTRLRFAEPEGARDHAV